MAANTKIEWCDHTWNPWTGCPDDGLRSPACQHCYAREWHKRFGRDFDTITRASDATFRAPSNRKKYKPGDKVFVCSLSDFFHEAVPDSLCAEAWDIVNERPDLIWMFLTKRPENISAPYNWAPYDPGGNFHNHWLGVTVENQEQTDTRIPQLLATPAAVRFVSVEPMLEPISFRWAKWKGLSRTESTNEYDGLRMLDWVICGGESGPGARPMHPDWARSLRDQCEDADVPFFFKQWGSKPPVEAFDEPFGKACAKMHLEKYGRLLDGQEHKAFPVLNLDAEENQ